MSAVAIIPARGGSTRLPRKNIRPFFGVPMLTRAIKTAQDSCLFRDIYVSTDDEEIAQVARDAGATIVMRPAELAVNDVGTQEVVKHCIQTLGLREMDEVCCIYPCTPLMTSDDLELACELQSAGYVIAVDDAHGGDLGWFYFGRAWYFTKDKPLWTTRTRVYPIGEWRAVDINTEDDFKRAAEAFGRME